MSETIGKKVLRAWRRGCLRSCLVVPVGLLLGVTMVASLLWLVRDATPGSARAKLAYALALAMPLAVLLSVLAVGGLIAGWRGRRLDRAFAQWQLEGSQAGFTMRGWHGEIAGRQLDAWFQKGPMLQLYLSCNPATRASVHRGGALAKMLNRKLFSAEPMNPSPLGLEGVGVWARDSEWVARLFGSAGAADAVRRLMEESARDYAVMHLTPRSVAYSRRFLRIADVTGEQVGVWVAALGEVADAVDALGPAAEGLEPTRMDAWARLSRGKHLNTILAVILGGGVVLMFLLLALGLLAG